MAKKVIKGKKTVKKPKHTIRIYLDTGITFEFYTDNTFSAREYAGTILKHGYRHHHGDGIVEWYPPHRIDKVSVSGLKRGEVFKGGDPEVMGYRS